MLFLLLYVGSHKKPVEPVEPVVSDTLSSQSGTSFAIATSYSDHVSTSSSMLSTSVLTDGLAQNVTQGGTQSGAQMNAIDDVIGTISSTTAQGSSQIEGATMSLSSGLTVAINSSVSINSNSSGMTTTMSSLEPFSSTAVSSQSQSSNLFTIGGSSSGILSGTGKMTPPPSSYADTTDNKGDHCYLCLLLCNGRPFLILISTVSIPVSLMV